MSERKSRGMRSVSRAAFEGLTGELWGTLWLAAADGESGSVADKCCVNLRLLGDYIQSNEIQELVIIKVLGRV